MLVVASGAAMAQPPAPQPAPATCDRTCLEAFVNQYLDAMVAHNRRSAKSHTGIWRDLAIRKRKTEVDEQIGPVVEIGRLHGIPTPITAALIELIHATEEGRRGLELAGLDDLAAAANPAVLRGATS